MADNAPSDSTFLITDLLIGLIYAFLFCYSIYRIIIIIKQSSLTQIRFLFYILIAISCLVRTIINSIFAIQCVYILSDKTGFDGNNLQKLFLNWLIIPDMIFFLIFLIVYRQCLILFYISHIRTGNILQQESKCPPASSRANKVFFYISLVYFLICVVIMIYANSYTQQENDKFDFNNWGPVLINDMILNYFIPFYFFITEIILHIMFSGSPYRSERLMLRTRYINRICIFVSIGRLIQGTLILLIYVNYDQVCNTIVTSSFSFSQILALFTGLATIFLAEIIPFIMFCNFTMIRIFLMNITQDRFIDDSMLRVSLIGIQQQNDNTGNEQSILESAQLKQPKEQVKQVIQSQQDLDSQFEQSLIIKKLEVNKFNIMNELKFSRLKGLGYIYKATFKQATNQGLQQTAKDNLSQSNQPKLFAMRFIPINNLSQYLLEGIQLEIDKQKNYKQNGLNIIYCVGQDTHGFVMLSDFQKNGSVADLVRTDRKTEQIMNDQLVMNEIDSNSGQLTFINKINLAYNIADKITFLHEQEPPLYHGHLTSSNILIDNQFNVKIADIGFTDFKKWMGLMHGYINKSQYTAPEHLTQKGNIVLNAQASSDVYSFAIILWEIFMEREPFSMVSLKDLITIVANENKRPIIQENGPIPEELSTLIRSCWQTEHKLRPNFQKIKNHLHKYLEQVQQ